MNKTTKFEDLKEGDFFMHTFDTEHVYEKIEPVVINGKRYNYRDIYEDKLLVNDYPTMEFIKLEE